MDNPILLELLESVLGKGIATAKNNYAFHCPVCNHHKKKLEIKLNTNDKGENAYHCWVCSPPLKGKTINSLFKKLNVSKDKLYELRSIISNVPRFKDDVTYETVELPKEFESLVDKKESTVKYRFAIRYLRGRGITPDDIIKYNIGCCNYGRYSNMVIIPSYDYQGNVNFFSARSVKETPYKTHDGPVNCDKNNVIGFEYLINWKLPLILTEGPFDAITSRRNTIPLFGKTISQALMKRLVTSEVKTIYLALDEDAIKQSLDYAEQLLDLGKDVYLIDLQGKDVNAIGFEKFIVLLHNAKQLRMGNLIQRKLQLI